MSDYNLHQRMEELDKLINTEGNADSTYSNLSKQDRGDYDLWSQAPYELSVRGAREFVSDLSGVDLGENTWAILEFYGFIEFIKGEERGDRNWFPKYHPWSKEWEVLLAEIAAKALEEAQIRDAESGADRELGYVFEGGF